MNNALFMIVDHIKNGVSVCRSMMFLLYAYAVNWEVQVIYIC